MDSQLKYKMRYSRLKSLTSIFKWMTILQMY